MSVRGILLRGTSMAAAAAICVALASKFGPWKAMSLWAVGVATVGGVVALLMHRQSPPEKISWINYLAGFVLPWGYRIGRGKLWPIAVTSWAIWMLLGVAVILATSSRGHGQTSAGIATVTSTEPSPHRNPVVMTLLCLAWLVDGGVLLRCVGLLATSANASHMMRSLALPMLVLAGILIASIALVVTSSAPAAARTALLIAGGPPLFVAMGYGLFVLVIVTVGRKARWN
jgi:hypothetical protein